MKSSEIIELIINSLYPGADSENVSARLEQEGISYDFKKGFGEAVISKIFPVALQVKQEIEFVKNMNFVFKSMALSAAVAIMVLILSIYLMEGSVSIDSFLGLRDNYDESIVCLLTGK
jgi:hypothetical protein